MPVHTVAIRRMDAARLVTQFASLLPHDEIRMPPGTTSVSRWRNEPSNQEAVMRKPDSERKVIAAIVIL